MFIRNALLQHQSDDIYKCYSPLLYKFLFEHKNIHPIYIGFNKKTKRKFWIFIKSDNLQEALTEWSNNKNTGKRFFN